MKLKRLWDNGVCLLLLGGLLVISACATTPQNMTVKTGDSIPQRSVTDWPKGLTVYYPEEAYKGYTIWTSLAGDGTVNLMDMRGNIVHKWKTRIEPGMYGKLLPGGNMLYSGRTTRGYGSGRYKMSGKGGMLIEYDWDGRTETRITNHDAHHDQQKLPNGNYAQVLWEKVPEGFAGRIPGGIQGTEFPDGSVFEERIVEVTPEGEEVWSWRASDHLSPAEHPIHPLHDRLEWLHINSIFYLEPGNPVTGKEGYLLSLRHTCQIIAIERATGKKVWSYGGHLPGEYGRLGGQHDATVIPEGYPGAGNVLVFDNGTGLPSVEAAKAYWGIDHSRILEIDPKTKRVVWVYQHVDQDWDFPIEQSFFFYAPYISGAQRLPNGNTFICDGPSGRLFEVTRRGRIAWEFINPESRAIYRAYRYGADSPELLGKTLPPVDPGASVVSDASEKLSPAAAQEPAVEEEWQEDEEWEDEEWEDEQPAMKAY